MQELHASYGDEYIPLPCLMDNHSWFFFGEESQAYGHTPTKHGVVPHASDPSSTRYSIIMNLEATPIDTPTRASTPVVVDS